MQNKNLDKPDIEQPSAAEDLSVDTTTQPPSAAEKISAELSAIEMRSVGEVPQNDEPVKPSVTDTSNSEAVRPVSLPILTEKQKSHKGLIVAVSTVFVALVAGAGGFGYWYNSVRLSDNEYANTASVIDVMLDNVKKIEAYDQYRKSKKTDSKESTSTTEFNLTSAKITTAADDTLDRLRDAKDRAMEYLSLQGQLANSAVVTKDEQVKSAYALNKKIIDEYGTSSKNTYGTMDVLMPVVLKCTEEIPTALFGYAGGEIKTTAEFNSSVKGCNDMLKSVESVPSKDINSTFYMPYRTTMQKVMSSMRDIFDAKTQKQYGTAVEKLGSTVKDMNDIDSTQFERLENSRDSTEQLKKVKAIIEERKKVFFR